MSKTTMSIQMLEILYSRSIVGIAELARLLDTNPRNIPEYKKELERAGYIIETIPGRYGGYALNKKYNFPATRLTESEQKGLMQGFDYLLSRNDFMRKDDYSRAMAKISAALMVGDTPENTLIANRFPLSMPQKEIEERYLALTHCLSSHTVLEIDYMSLKNQVTKRKIHPYKLFMYNNAWFVLAYDCKGDKVAYFKVNRIQRFKITTERFRIPLSYNERDYLDEYGMKQNGEWYPIEIVLSGKQAVLAKERIYGKNQVIEEREDGSVCLKVEMQNREDILSFVLGFGPFCKVEKPFWLKEDVLAALEKIKNNYN